MLDWLRYFPLALGFLKRQDYLTPKGPYFSKLRSQRWLIGDSVFHFKAPWANSVYGAATLSRSSESRSVGNDDLLKFRLQSYVSDWMPSDRWQYSWLYKREWYFVGPWFSGMRTSLLMSANIIGQVERDDFSSSSFFHPRVFETAIADYLNSFYGHEKIGRKPRYRGPLNWSVLPISASIQVACFDIHQVDQSTENPNLRKHIFFPVSHSRFINIVFDYGGTRILENHCDPAPMFELNQAILDTFRLEVGPEMQAQWDQVKAYCPDMSLTPDFAELKWPIKPEDVGKAEATPAVASELNKVEFLKQQTLSED